MILNFNKNFNYEEIREKYNFFYKNETNWISIDFININNLKKGTFFIMVKKEKDYLKNLFIVHNNFGIKLYLVNINILSLEDCIDYFYLDCGLKLLFENEYKSNFKEYTDLFN